MISTHQRASRIVGLVLARVTSLQKTRIGVRDCDLAKERRCEKLSPEDKPTSVPDYFPLSMPYADDGSPEVHGKLSI